MHTSGFNYRRRNVGEDDNFQFWNSVVARYGNGLSNHRNGTVRAVGLGELIQIATDLFRTQNTLDKKTRKKRTRMHM